MGVSIAHAFIVRQIALGRIPDFSLPPMSSVTPEERVVAAEWIREIAVHTPMDTEFHREVATHFPDYAPYVPNGFGPVRVGPTGIRIKGATIKGKLDLTSHASAAEHIAIPAMSFEYCTFEGDGELDREGKMTCILWWAPYRCAGHGSPICTGMALRSLANSICHTYRLSQVRRHARGLA
jgi:hypothetical protein